MPAALGQTSATCSRLPTEPEHELVPIGRVGRPHGVDGAFVVDQASEDPTWFEVDRELLVDGEPARVVVTRQVGGRRYAIKLDRAVARGAELAVRRDVLPELPADTYYVADLVGLDVVDERGARVGVVRDVLPARRTTCSSWTRGVLLPLVEECVREVDLDGRRVHLNPGFID